MWVRARVLFPCLFCVPGLTVVLQGRKVLPLPNLNSLSLFLVLSIPPPVCFAPTLKARSNLLLSPHPRDVDGAQEARPPRPACFPARCRHPGLNFFRQAGASFAAVPVGRIQVGTLLQPASTTSTAPAGSPHAGRTSPSSPPDHRPPVFFLSKLKSKLETKPFSSRKTSISRIWKGKWMKIQPRC